MAGFGGGAAGGAGNRKPWQPGMEMPGLMGFPGAAGQGAAAAGPPVFQAGNPSAMTGIPGLGAVHAGGHNPAVTLAAGLTAQPGVSYPRPLGPGFTGPGGAAGHAQQILQQQAAAAQAAVTLQQQQQHLQAAQQQAQSKSGQGGQSNQRVFTGTVTKFHENFGFVDNDVFFQTSVTKGQLPKVNDRVLVEASYNPNMPFRWNATRVQVLPGQPPAAQQQQQGGGGASVNPTATPNAQAFSNQGSNHHQHQAVPKRDFGRDRGGGGAAGGGGGSVTNQDNRQPVSRINNSKGEMSRKQRGGGGGGDGPSIGRIGGGGGGDRERSKDRRSSPASSSRKRSRSPRRSTRSRSRSRSPPRRRQRAIPRYSVSVPKIPLHFPSSNVMDLRKRYCNMYVPSDFFDANHVWNDSFPIHQPFKFQYSSAFHVFSKDQVQLPIASDAVFDPQDADHTWNAKVMLMATPPPEELYLKTCQMADSSFHNKDSLVHPTRAIQFLVGVRGKNEAMAIGGPWSPSLDGPNPGSDPSVLVRTATRACKALTGIDLTACTRWCRFLEIHYRRQESSSKPARTETTVIYLPDIWSVMPNQEEFEKLQELYAEALESKINPKKKEAPKKETKPAKPEPAPDAQEDQLDEQEVEMMESELAEEEKFKVEKASEEEAAAAEPAEPAAAAEDEGKPEPTPWKELDIKSLKVTELRAELEARGLNSKGLRSQLVARLQKCLKQEEEAEEEQQGAEETKEETADETAPPAPEEVKTEVPDVEEKVETEEPPKEEKEVKEETPEIMEVEEILPVLDEKQKAALTVAYKLPAHPSILVHPHPKAKSGKFDCTVMSLSVLLDYRTDDNKEGTFEVSLFAELFNEMLMRDSGYKIYRSITDQQPAAAAAPAKASESPKEGEETEPKKLVTRNKELLMACSYFDLGHGGYIETKDVEDILQATTLCLSRAQIKKLVAKVVQKDRLNYRQFTDRPENEEPKPLELKSVEEEAEMGLGFKAFLPKSEALETSSAKEGICSYKGTVVDVGKLMSQLERSEQEKFDSESRLGTTQKILVNLKEAAEKHNSVKDKLQNEVKDLKKKLRSVEDELKKVQSENSKFLSTITHIYNRVSPIAAPPPSTASSAGTEQPKSEATKSNEKELQNGKKSDSESK